MGYRYRRESNFLGCFMVVALGGALFGGLILALVYFRGKAEEKEKKAQANLPKTDHPTLGREPEAVVKEQLKKMYAKDGKALESRYGMPKEVRSETSKRPVVIILVEHREAGSEGPYTQEVFVLDRTKITKCAVKDWPKAKGNDFGIAEDPPGFSLSDSP
jgi:hypothetical protein